MKSAMFKSTGLVLGTLFCVSIACAATTPSERKSETDLVTAAFDKMDANGDAQVSREEFNAFMASRLANQRASLEQAFNSLDTNGDHGISKTEAAANAALEQHFAEVDANHDGKISLDELVDAARAAQMADAQE
ncbi:Ca2+-binding EF-hand superfamily protein [Rhodanobacter sp. TND4EL1]